MKPTKYVIAVTAILSIAMSAEAKNPFVDLIPTQTRQTRGISSRSLLPVLMQNENEGASWLPSTAVRTNWDGMQWVPYGKYTFSYDSNGNVTEEISESLVTTGQYLKYAKRLYTYDASGRLCHTSLMAGETLDNLEELQYADLFYDEVLTDLVICQESYTLTDGQWVTDDQSYRRNITRDRDGNIVEMIAQTYFEGEFIDVESLALVYKEGKPDTLKERVLTQDENTGELKLEETECYSDCQWYWTDGQITSLDDITVGKNHLKSANVTTPDVSDMTLSIAYKNNSDDYTSTSTATLMYVIPTTTVFEYTGLPYGGSFQKTVQDMEIPQYGHAQKIVTLDNQFDAWGNLIISKQETTYGATTIDKWLQGEFVSDEVYGYPLQYIQKEFFQYQGQSTGEWENKYKVDYSGYVQPSVSITEVSSEDNGKVRYFTIDGRECFGKLIPGIYVRLNGSRAEKIIVK